MGRPTFTPTTEQRKEVELLGRYGIPHEDIAVAVGISLPTLYKHFRLDLDVALVKANAKVAESIFMQAVGAPAQYYPPGHPNAGKVMRAEQPRVLAAGIWWERTRSGRSEYAPLRPKPLGKKEAAQLAATSAAKGTDWAELVDESRAN